MCDLGQFPQILSQIWIKLQNYVKNNLTVKNSVSLSNWLVGKVMKSKRQPRNDCDGIRWWQHKLTWIAVIEIFAINPYHHSHFTAVSFFHIGHFKQSHTVFCFFSFLQLGYFWILINTVPQSSPEQNPAVHFWW